MTSFLFKLIATVRISVSLRRRPRIRRVIHEGLTKRLCVTVLRVTVEVPVSIPIVTIDVAFLVTIAKSLFKEGGDVVYHTTQLLVTICLCGLETTSNMSPNERHGDGI
jgi:hypothetical protein